MIASLTVPWLLGYANACVLFGVDCVGLQQDDDSMISCFIRGPEPSAIIETCKSNCRNKEKQD